ncbi:hypothetical protein ABL78_0905 [Leptomonas seymouri]|uniref:Complex 1 LYR protein domain-containing protein n=1 Tax=Leptomonas seymouri TaxID=5684 RepID=A0A0N0P8U5_LEPSE|nr:hypothetical protein ABL78_0905 [Leptomonas seymouri]|eukprot:KPI89937.1 hypothetical protein ABL78_0905 [Leptomonas seymouri]
MKGCLRTTRCMLHQRRDRGGNTHNFPFDTLTKVYRDTMYATQERYLSNPMYPERGPHNSVAAAPSPATSSPPSSNVTNHVGNIGVMSPAATPLSKWMEELHQHPNPEADAHDHVHGVASPPKHTRIAGNARMPHRLHDISSASDAAAASGQAPSATTVNDEAVRERLMARLAREKGGSKSSSTRTSSAFAAATARHSGVQLEILSMYRRMLREVGRMEDPDTRRNLTAYIRSEFEKHRDVPRKNILKIEWLLNYGKRKLEDLQAMGQHTRFSMMR